MEYRIVVYAVLNCDNIAFDGLVDSSQGINLLYDDITRHCHVITNLTAAIAKRYVCKTFKKVCESVVTHTCDQACSDCMASSPRVFARVRIPCHYCNRYFRNQTCFDNTRRRRKQPEARKTMCVRKKDVDCLGIL